MTLDTTMEFDESDSLQRQTGSREINAFDEIKLFEILVDIGPTSVQDIKNYLENKQDILRRGKYEETYLHVLCAPISFEKLHFVVPIIYQLVDAGIDVNARDKEGNTPLHVCAINELELDMCAAFLRLGADPSAKNNYGQEPIDLAESDELKNLIKYYQPGLWQAVKENDFDRVKVLVEAWSTVAITRDGQRLEKLAKLHEDRQIYNYLKEASATSKLINNALSGNSRDLRKILKDPSEKLNVDVKDGYIFQISERRWPLLAEVLRLQLWEAAKALTKFADVNQKVDSVEGKTFLLFEWVMKSVPDLDFSFLKALLKHADVSKINSLEMLLYLWKKGYPPEIIEHFVRAGFSLSTRDKDGFTLRDLILVESYELEVSELRKVLYAVDKNVINLAKEGKVDMLRKLLLDGYDYMLVFDLKDRHISDIAEKENQTEGEVFLRSVPKLQKSMREIQKAIQLGNLQLVKCILNEELAFARDRGGHSLLHTAMLFERTFIIKYLMKKYPGLVHYTDNLGRTPLHYAVCLYGMDDIEDQLTALGADEAAPDKEGNTPMEYKSSPMALQMIPLERNKTYGEDAYLLYHYLMLVETIKSGNNEKLSRIIEDLTGVDLNKVNGLPEKYDKLVFRPLLFVCVENEKEDMAQVLIKAGADYNIAAKIPVSDDTSQIVTLQEAATIYRQDNLVQFIKKHIQREEEKIKCKLALNNTVKKLSVAQLLLRKPFNVVTNDSLSPPPNKRAHRHVDGKNKNDDFRETETTNSGNAKSSTCIIL